MRKCGVFWDGTSVDVWGVVLKIFQIFFELPRTFLVARCIPYFFAIWPDLCPFCGVGWNVFVRSMGRTWLGMLTLFVACYRCVDLIANPYCTLNGLSLWHHGLTLYLRFLFHFITKIAWCYVSSMDGAGGAVVFAVFGGRRFSSPDFHVIYILVRSGEDSCL